uniref:Tf2-1-like SH3-like domain-containing protein n=1 Tax=Peronospora matthiolae TaxID=2874970 RepID=A0AAV1UYX8_9STRA
MSTFKKGDLVLLSTEGLRDSAVTNLSASKLATRFKGPFAILKVIGDAYALDIPSSLRLHPTFYVGRLKEYRPATLHGLAPSSETKAHRSAFPLALLDAPATSEAAASHSARALEPGPVQLDQGLLQLPAGHRQPCSPPHLHRPGQPGRRYYHREGPPPLVDAEGQKRWIVKRLLGHEDPRRETKLSRLHARAIIVYVGSGFYPRRMHGNRALRFFETFQMSFVHTLGSNLFDDLSIRAVSENETNDDCVVVKRHHDYETKRECENVVVKRHHDDEMKSDDENIVVNCITTIARTRTSWRACGTTFSRTRVVSPARRTTISRDFTLYQAARIPSDPEMFILAEWILSDVSLPSLAGWTRHRVSGVTRIVHVNVAESVYVPRVLA